MAAQSVYSVPPTTSTRTGWLVCNCCPCTDPFPRSPNPGGVSSLVADEGHATFRRRRVKAAPDPNQPAQGRISDSDDAQLHQHCPQRPVDPLRYTVLLELQKTKRRTGPARAQPRSYLGNARTWATAASGVAQRERAHQARPQSTAWQPCHRRRHHPQTRQLPKTPCVSPSNSGEAVRGCVVLQARSGLQRG